MALSEITLGAGTAQSGMTSPGRYMECSGCGFEATCDHEGRDGKTYPFCEDCLWRIREMEDIDRELEEADCQECADCGAALGPDLPPCRFLHLTKGVFWLCSDCWVNADHEEDYLENCTCSDKVYCKLGEESLSCYSCWKPVKHVQHCDCPVPSIDKETPNHCLFCKGAVMNKKDE